MIQDKQDGLKPDETAEINHIFSPDSGEHRGRLESPESWKKPGTYCGISTIFSGLRTDVWNVPVPVMSLPAGGLLP